VVTSLVVLMLGTTPSAMAFYGGGTPTADTSPTADTGPVDALTGDTGGLTIITTDSGFAEEDDTACPNCLGAADLAGDAGGSPCGSCTTGSASPWLGLLAVLGLGRRRR